MREVWHRVLNLLNLNGRDWVVFVLALLLAFSVWFIHKLSQSYNSYLHVNIVAHCNIPGHANVSEGKGKELIVRCTASGFRILGRDESVDVEFSELRHKGGDEYYVTRSDIRDHLTEIFGPEVIVEQIITDTLVFTFPKESHNKVPVVAETQFTYEDQYMPIGELQLTPDSVYVYGDPYLINSITEVRTRPIKKYEVSEDISNVIELEELRGVRISESSVHYSQDVGRFVEMVVPVAVEPVNVPSGKKLHVYPSVVDIALRCRFPLMGDPEKKVRLEVDYEDFVEAEQGICPLRVIGLTEDVLRHRLPSSYVSCIVEEL